MGFSGSRVSIDTFPQLSSSSFLLTEAVLNVLGATWCRGKPRHKGTIRIRIISSLNSEFIRWNIMSFTLGIIFQGDHGETGPTGQGGLKVSWPWQLMHQIKGSLLRWYFRMFSKPFKEILGCTASLWDLMFSKSETHTHTHWWTGLRGFSDKHHSFILVTSELKTQRNANTLSSMQIQITCDRWVSLSRFPWRRVSDIPRRQTLVRLVGLHHPSGL